MILIIKHIDIETPGSLGEFFKNTDWEVETIELEKDDKLPGTFSDIEAVITLGGPMNVYEENRYPFLKDEDIFLRDAIKEELPILGICLGAQLLAKACGANVRKAGHKEIGWHKIELTKEGAEDPLFEGLDGRLDVFQWHEDEFELPKGAKLLASSKACHNQAFKVGKNAYGLQFHIEITAEMIRDWSKAYLDAKGPKEQLKGKQMLIDYYNLKALFDKQANRLYLNFSRKICPRH